MKNKKIKTLTSSIWKHILSATPLFLRKTISEHFIQLDLQPRSQLKFKLAQSKEELEQAFHLMYQTLIRDDLIRPNHAQMHITPYHALPSTSIIIACLDNKVIGTVSLFRGGTFGIPISKLYDLSRFEKEGLQFAEISFFAIEQNSKINSTEIYFGLLKYLFEYSTRFLDLDLQFALIMPYQRLFFETVLLFEPIENRIVKNYVHLNNKHVIAEFINLNNIKELYKRSYQNHPTHKNLDKYFFESPLKNFEFPDRKIKKISDPVITPDLLQYFFIEKMPILRNLDVFELTLLRQIYQTEEYHKIFENSELKNHMIPFHYFSREFRIETKCNSLIFFDQTHIYPAKVHDVSLNGFLAHLDLNLELHKAYQIKIEIEPNLYCQVEATLCWTNENGYKGFKISKSGQDWLDFINKLSLDLLKVNKAS